MAAGPAADYESQTIEIDGETPVDFTVNDYPVKMLIAPDSKSIPTLNEDAASRVQLKPSMIGFRYLVGAARLGFSTDVARWNAGHGEFKRRTAFGPPAIVEGADGELGPGALPFEQVRFKLGNVVGEQIDHVFPLDVMSRSQVGTLMKIGDYNIHVAFSLSRKEALATATAGSIIAKAYGGGFADDVRTIPIRYGIARPVRTLDLERPLMLGSLIVRDLAVRVGDNGSVRSIEEKAESAASSDDPDEIVVTAEAIKRKKVKDQTLIVGRASLIDCSYLTYDFEKKEVRLRCKAP